MTLIVRRDQPNASRQRATTPSLFRLSSMMSIKVCCHFCGLELAASFRISKTSPPCSGRLCALFSSALRSNATFDAEHLQPLLAKQTFQRACATERAAALNPCLVVQRTNTPGRESANRVVPKGSAKRNPNCPKPTAPIAPPKRKDTTSSTRIRNFAPSATTLLRGTEAAKAARPSSIPISLTLPVAWVEAQSAGHIVGGRDGSSLNESEKC